MPVPVSYVKHAAPPCPAMLFVATFSVAAGTCANNTCASIITLQTKQGQSSDTPT